MAYVIAAADLLPQESPAPGWTRVRLPGELGDCRSDRFTLGEDLSLVYTRYRPVHDFGEQSHQTDGARLLALTFALQGESGYQGRDGSTLAFRNGHTTVTSFHNSSGERRFRADASTTQLRLLVGERTLAQYLGADGARRLLGAERVRQLDFAATSPAARTHLDALTCCAQTHSSDALRMHIHMLSLLAGQLERLRPTSSAPALLDERDIERLEALRDFMQANLAQPITIACLCARAGMNETRLKEGFRRHFKTTPYRMLTGFRMHRAQQLLESGRQVAETAYLVGYHHPGNFSVAFSRFFGKPPKSVLRPSHIS